jgi:rhodanese-related sulfurtransferase
MTQTPARLINIFLFFITCMTSISYAANSDYRSPEQVEGAITTSLQEAKVLFDKGVVFIDVRNPRLYAKKHIPGAFHLDLKNAFNEAAVTAIAKKNQAIVIYCSGVKCSRSTTLRKKRYYGASGKYTTSVVASLNGKTQLILSIVDQNSLLTQRLWTKSP